ncbi:MAG: phenylacetate--CoA ligase, partial [Thermodesulfobacteriota bacterium]
VEEGEVGEVVITTLTKEAFPMIRYRTRDLTRFLPEPCPCGRTFKRMHRILGRNDDMLIIKGVNVFPTQIESVLFGIDGTEPHYRIIVERENHQDRATVMVEVKESLFSDQMSKQRELIDTIRKQLVSELGIGVKVQLVEEKTLERFEGKGQRVIDKRKI